MNVIILVWRELLRDKLVRLASIGVFVLTLVSIVLIIISWQRLPPLVPLWYSRAWGTDQLAESAYLFILPVGILTWYVITSLIAYKFTRAFTVFLHVLFLSCFLVAIMSTITLINIILVIS